MDKIIEQLKNYCACTDITEEDVLHLINLISMATCWVRTPCETFLFAERREVIDLPDCLQCNVYEFEPYYSPYDTDSFTFTLIKQEGIEETSTAVEGNYSEVDRNFKLSLDLPDCDCLPSCGCDVRYKLLVTYNAGYEELPDCLLPIFCEAYKFLTEEGTCTDCSTEYSTETIYVGDGASLADRLDDYFAKVLFVQYVRHLGMISLCKSDNEIWGFVV